MATRKPAKKRYVIAQASSYLDVLNCGSMVSYSVIHGRRGVHGDIQLTDCDKKIQWWFSADKDAIAKIDKAIEMLSAFRDTFVPEVEKKLEAARLKRKATRDAKKAQAEAAIA